MKTRQEAEHEMEALLQGYRPASPSAKSRQRIMDHAGPAMLQPMVPDSGIVRRNAWRPLWIATAAAVLIVFASTKLAALLLPPSPSIALAGCSEKEAQQRLLNLGMEIGILSPQRKPSTWQNSFQGFLPASEFKQLWHPEMTPS